MAKMSELKISDPKMYDALRAKFSARDAAKKANLALILAFAAEKGDEKIKALAKAMLKPTRVAGTRQTSASLLTDMFKGSTVPNQMHEDEIFKKFRVGRSEMRNYSIRAIKNVKPEERVWVSFDPTSGVYKLAGTGKDAPANWKGYRPLVVDGVEVK